MTILIKKKKKGQKLVQLFAATSYVLIFLVWFHTLSS